MMEIDFMKSISEFDMKIVTIGIPSHLLGVTIV